MGKIYFLAIFPEMNEKYSKLLTLLSNPDFYQSCSPYENKALENYLNPHLLLQMQEMPMMVEEFFLLLNVGYI